MRRWLGLLCLLVPASALAADVHDYVGAEACGTCHTAQLEAWRTGPHVGALRRLDARQAQNPVCRSCHTMVPTSDRPALQGVQCESCHGAGRTYAPGHVMRDPLLAELLGLQPITEATCAGCHQAHAPAVPAFDYTRALKRVCTHRIAEEGSGPPETEAPGSPRNP